MITPFFKLDEDHIKILEKKISPVIISEKEEIIHLQLSQNAWVLTEGHLSVLKNDDPFLLINPGYLIGLNHLITGNPMSLKCQAREAKLLPLGKEDLPHLKINNRISQFFDKFQI
jgi:hypothetical protein